MTGLDQLPDEIAEALKKLSRDEIHSLADDVHIAQHIEHEKSLPSDPKEAVEAIGAVRLKRFTEEIDCAFTELADLLWVLRMVLSATERQGLDPADMMPLWRLADRAHDMALFVRAKDRRISDHARAVTHPRKD